MDILDGRRYIMGMTSAAISVYLLDDHQVVRDGLELRINGMSGFRVCGSAGKADAALAAVQELRPDIVVLDLSLGERMSFDLAETMKNRLPAVKILIYSLHEDVNSIERALRAGADGYCTKSEPIGHFETALRELSKGQRYIREDLKEELLTRLLGNETQGARDPVRGLSSKEFVVFSMIGKGWAVDEIATELGLSPKTVNNHRDNIKTKLGIASTRELVQYAIRWQMVSGGLVSGPLAPE